MGGGSEGGLCVWPTWSLFHKSSMISSSPLISHKNPNLKIRHTQEKEKKDMQKNQKGGYMMDGFAGKIKEKEEIEEEKEETVMI